MKLDGFYIIYAEPLGKIQHLKSRTAIPQSRGRLATMKEVEIPGLGKRLVRYGDTGHCILHDNCFTCPYPVDECTGGEYSHNVRKRKVQQDAE